MTRDWRLPENRREAFLRFYGFHLKHKSHPGGVYALLPALAEAYNLDERGRAWLVWLNGNTQNPATSLLLLEASDCSPDNWKYAVRFWNDNFKQLEWDTDRRYQKSRFADATSSWAAGTGFNHKGWASHCGQRWGEIGALGWGETWKYASGQPHMGRLSAWSMIEYARILLPGIPDADTLLLRDKSGSRSHRNGLALLAGAPLGAEHWSWDEAVAFTGIETLEQLGASLLAEARERFPDEPDVSYLTLESALCTWKSWHKPNRRYPNVYSDVGYLRLKRAEAYFGPRFDVLWAARRATLPEYLRLEDNPHDPGLSPEKQNLYRETGVPPMMHREYPDMINPLNLDIEMGLTPVRKDPTWS